LFKTGASKGTHGDAKCVTKIPGDKIKETRGDKIQLMFMSKMI